MKITGETLVWTGIVIGISLGVGALAGGWFESETPGILSNILKGLTV